MLASLPERLVTATKLGDEETFWSEVAQLTKNFIVCGAGRRGAFLILELGELFPVLIVPFTVSREATVQEALGLMRAHNVRSLPIVDNSEYVAMVDVADIAAFFATEMVDTEPECITDEVSASLLQRSVLSISNLSQRDPLVPFYVGSPLSALMRIFASGVHRCPLVNERGQFVSMVAQRDVLALFWTLRSHWESLGATACRDVSPLIGRVKSVHESYLALDCFRKLRDERVSALAIVQDGVLVATLSATDILRVRDAESLRALLSPIGHFLKTAEAWPVAVDDTAPFAEAVKLLLEQELHRVWLLGEETGIPVGVVSTTDVCAQMTTLLPRP